LKQIEEKMKIAIITDVHGNLPALQAVLKATQRDGVDLLVHLGDVIAIGPFPAECLDVLLNVSKAQFIMGNHDKWLVHGLPQPQPEWMSDGEVMHQQWTHKQIAPAQKTAVSLWPMLIQHNFTGVSVSFLHYALAANGRDFMPIINQPTATDFDLIFPATELVFYGHTHRTSDIQGRARYINPGSLGCQPEAVAPYTIVVLANGRYTIEHHTIPYDDEPLAKAFAVRQVPEREFLCQAFFGGRF
jgi:putative phosphoesterase